MTELRFVGDWGPWLGVALGLLAAVAVAMLYRRELRDRQGAAPWLLPPLRAAAVFLVVMMLTGPVLHHRQLVGQLVDLKLVADGSRSMGLTDPQMEAGRKLLLARALGLLDADLPHLDCVEAANGLADACRIADDAMEKRSPAELRRAATVLRRAVETAGEQLAAVAPEGQLADIKPGFLHLEYWHNIPGAKVENLTQSPTFMGKPQAEEDIDRFEPPRQNFGDNYGTRITGFVIPPASGDYRFRIQGDDESQLWLGGLSGEPKRMIASEPNWGAYGQWAAHPEQTSKPIRLEGGRRYPVEVLHKEDTGGDFVAVGWVLPDGTEELPIPGSRLAVGTQRSNRAWMEQASRLTELDPAKEEEARELITRLGATIESSRTAEAALRAVFHESATAATTTTTPTLAGGITSGLIGHWKLDEGSGTEAADSSGSGITGTLVNDPLWVAGKINSALDFSGAGSGAGSHVTLGSGLNMGSGDFTMAAWINRDSVTGVRGIIGTSSVGGAGFFVYEDGGGQQFLGLGKKNVSDMGSPALTITAGTWYHAAVVMNRGTASVTFYLNGVASAATSYDPDAFSAVTDRIGSYGGGEMFDGKIDDARIYNRALSQSEVTELYNYPPPTTTLELLEDPAGAVGKAVAALDGMTRWQRLQARLFGGSDPLLDAFVGDHDVELMVLNDDAVESLWRGRAGRLKGSGDIPTAFEVDADGLSTDLNRGLSVEQSGEDAAGAAEAARPDEDRRRVVVLISDGRHNRGDSPLQAAKVLGNMGVPFFAIAMGSARTAGDLAVVDAEAPESVFFKDRVKGRIVLVDAMPAGQTFTLKIAHDGETVWEKDLVTQAQGVRQVDYDFPVEALVTEITSADPDGIWRTSLPLSFDVNITGLTDDREPENNSRPFSVRAIVQKHRMLLVEARPRWEWRFVHSMFERDERWEVNSVIARAEAFERGDQPGQFPADRDTLFAYDVIWFGDVGANLLSPDEQTWLRDFVADRGGGLICVDSPREHLKAYASGPMKPLLPVEWIAPESAELPSALQLTPAGAALAALQLSGETDTGVWATLPPPRWTAAVRALPGTESLADCMVGEKAVPWLVSRRYGSGTVLYSGNEELWRWRYKIGARYHQQFWFQVADWVMEAPYAVRDQRVAIDAGSASYNPGDAADVRVKLTDAEGRPQTGATATARLRRDGRVVSDLVLRADERASGIYRARTGPLEPGNYEVAVAVSGDAEGERPIHAVFSVRPQDAGELTQLSADPALMQQLATAAGGRMYLEEDLSDLVSALKPLSHGRIVEHDTALWQSYWWFLVVMLLLTTEWVARRLAGMM